MSAAASPVFAVRRNPSLVDFPGKIAVSFFLTGCNFRCGFCHNASLIAGGRERYSWEKLGQICRLAGEQWVDAVVVTGGEPTVSSGLPELLGFLKEAGMDIKLDTNGGRPDVLSEVMPLVDYVAMDVKCALSSYPEFVGFQDVEQIRRSVELLKSGSVDAEFRTTVVECFHSDGEMHAIGELIQTAPRYVLQPFLPREDLPDPELRNQPRTTPERLRELQQLMAEYADEVVTRGT